MLEYVVKNFKERHNEKQIIGVLDKKQKLVFNLVCDLIQSALDEIEMIIESMTQ